MATELCQVFQSMVDMQPLCMADPAIRAFPAKLFDCFTTDKTDEDTWRARTEASILAAQIIVRMAEDDEVSQTKAFRGLVKKWKARIAKLSRSEEQLEVKEGLSSLASALRDLHL